MSSYASLLVGVRGRHQDASSVLGALSVHPPTEPKATDLVGNRDTSVTIAFDIFQEPGADFAT
jgi:hypothetical protein